MKRAEKEEMKSVKVTASTHMRLTILSTALNKTISEVIDDTLRAAYPEVVEATDKVLGSMDDLKQLVERRQRERAKQ